MRKLIVVVTLLYTALAVAALAYLSNGFREVAFLAASPVALSLAAGVVPALVVAVIAYLRLNEWLVLVLIAIVAGSVGMAIKFHHDAYGEWLPSLPAGEVVSSGEATTRVHGRNLRYRLELHNPGSVSHREYLVVLRDGHVSRFRLPLFGEVKSGYIGPKTPADWIVLKPTENADVVDAETGRLLLVQKRFRVNLATGQVNALGVVPGR